jgi:hypothetical protein
MRKLRIKTPVEIVRKRLKIKARRPAQRNFDPLRHQLDERRYRMVFCSTLPVDHWRQRDRKHTIFRYRNRSGLLKGPLLGTYRQRPNGRAISRARGRRVGLDIRNFSGEVRATVRLGDQCSFATAELRNGKNSLVFPIVTNPNP